MQATARSRAIHRGNTRRSPARAPGTLTPSDPTALRHRAPWPPLLGFGLGLLLSSQSACFGKSADLECEEGSEGCACFPNSTCLDALACIDGRCMPAGTTETTSPDTSAGSSDDAETTAPGMSSTSTAGTGTVDTSSSSDGGSDTETPPCPGETITLGVIEADTNISVGSPNNNYGVSTLSNIGVGRALLRFELPQTAATALLEQRVTQMTLTLTRVQQDPGCGPTCPAQDGTLNAFPLRNEWAEGTGNGNEPGATWIRRYLADTPWEVPGAEGPGTDRGALAASAPTTIADATVTLTLDPATFTPAWIVNHRLSLIVETPDNAVFVAATDDNNVYAPPTLELTFCP